MSEPSCPCPIPSSPLSESASKPGNSSVPATLAQSVTVMAAQMDEAEEQRPDFRVFVDQRAASVRSLAVQFLESRMERNLDLEKLNKSLISILAQRSNDVDTEMVKSILQMTLSASQLEAALILGKDVAQLPPQSPEPVIPGGEATEGPSSRLLESLARIQEVINASGGINETAGEGIVKNGVPASVLEGPSRQDPGQPEETLQYRSDLPNGGTGTDETTDGSPPEGSEAARYDKAISSQIPADCD